MTPAELEQQPQRERYDQREKREAAERESDFKKAMTVTAAKRKGMRTSSLRARIQPLQEWIAVLEDLEAKLLAEHGELEKALESTTDRFKEAELAGLVAGLEESLDVVRRGPEHVGTMLMVPPQVEAHVRAAGIRSKPI